MKVLCNFQNITSEVGGQAEPVVFADWFVPTRKSGKKKIFIFKNEKSFEFETYSMYYYSKRQQNHSHIYNNHHP